MQQPASVPEKADVVVIGGGINGINTFRELAMPGVDVVLLERDDFCSGAMCCPACRAWGTLSREMAGFPSWCGRRWKNATGY